eukprot:CAMPEP_0172529540 /NCGR_PEP_ID=MMETSP1067-20121228/3601_1 /TAXON_ID=265564 ORGANISM="Thalassiosira punctigera, Strain Tpunct2005C2" /NCGR_SAMPLE_ID=MMETSP1067 /ASSEMBLY_ACC=CAM_ASM_000444 /LENGTH=409 /DNA_ID=CAMNT_0013313609 /DNA_START=317 /DNA_END=1546 /DNA_ORIENTATION=+
MAYAAHTPVGALWGKLMYYVRFNPKAFVAGAGLILFALVCVTDVGPGGGVTYKLRGSGADHWGGAVHPGYFAVEDAIVDDHTFRFAAVTDLDKLSVVKDSNKPLYRSTLLPGVLTRDDAANRYSIQFEPIRTLVSQHNEAGRGMELSELTVYKKRLLSFDDRTGTVFEILSTPDGSDSYVVPRFVITEGDGDTDKGMKWEWATIKNNELILGSMGKEFTGPNGEIENTNNLWVAVLNERGELRRDDWKDKFDFVRELVGASPPGYIIMEAILWSDHLKKWVFLPRRISSSMYDEVEDERKGSNRVVLVNEKFTEGSVVEIQMKTKDMDPLHGFSTFAFVPGTNDHHALAVRSVEEDCTGALEDCKQRSYLIVFDILTGEVLMDELQIDLAEKFEGIEFVNIFIPPPKWS